MSSSTSGRHEVCQAYHVTSHKSNKVEGLTSISICVRGCLRDNTNSCGALILDTKRNSAPPSREKTAVRTSTTYGDGLHKSRHSVSGTCSRANMVASSAMLVPSSDETKQMFTQLDSNLSLSILKQNRKISSLGRYVAAAGHVSSLRSAENCNQMHACMPF